MIEIEHDKNKKHKNITKIKWKLRVRRSSHTERLAVFVSAFSKLAIRAALGDGCPQQRLPASSCQLPPNFLWSWGCSTSHQLVLLGCGFVGLETCVPRDRVQRLCGISYSMLLKTVQYSSLVMQASSQIARCQTYPRYSFQLLSIVFQLLTLCWFNSNGKEKPPSGADLGGD